MDTQTTIAFSGYLLIVLSVAIAAWFVTRNLSDFVLGGRRLGGAIAALSSGASDMSAWLLLGLPGAFYVSGLNAVWLPLGLTIGAYLNWLIVGKRLRVYSEAAEDSLTVPSFLDHRFADGGRSIRLLSAIVMVLFFTTYTASGLVAGAHLMERTFSLDYQWALISASLIIMLYTLVGGFLAVSWTDFVQGLFMMCCLMVVPYLAMTALGGFSSTLQDIQNARPHALEPTYDQSMMGVANLLVWGFGYFGQPHILVRFMAVRSPREIPLARRICVSWMALSMMGAALVGILGIAFFKDTIGNPELVFIGFSQALFSPWMAGIVMAAILSSTMCAIDSQMLASSSALTEDVFHNLIGNKASPKTLILFGRLSVILMAGVAFYIASNPHNRVLDLVGFSWAGLGSSFAPSVLASLFFRHLKRKAVLYSIGFGALTVLVWKIGFEWTHVYEMIPGLVASTFGLIFGQLLDKSDYKKAETQFDAVLAQMKEA